MKRVLVDSSVWISFFKDRDAHPELTGLIETNQICTNNLILAELIPFLKMKNQNVVIESLLTLPNIPLTIHWNSIIDLQIHNLRNGANKVGIPDLIVVDHVVTNGLILYSEDRHFSLMQKYIHFELLQTN